MRCGLLAVRPYYLRAALFQRRTRPHFLLRLVCAALLLGGLLAVPVGAAAVPCDGVGDVAASAEAEHAGTWAPVVQHAAPCETVVNPFQGPPVTSAKQRVTGQAFIRRSSDRYQRNASREQKRAVLHLRLAEQRAVLLFPFHFFW